MYQKEFISIRTALDAAALPDTPILCYASKFASAFDGPFRKPPTPHPVRRPPHLSDGRRQPPRSHARDRPRRCRRRRPPPHEARPPLPRRYPGRKGPLRSPPRRLPGLRRILHAPRRLPARLARPRPRHPRIPPLHPPRRRRLCGDLLRQGRSEVFVTRNPGVPGELCSLGWFIVTYFAKAAVKYL